MASGGSDKSRLVALVLSVLIGWVGAHRFYVGKVGTGLLQLVTFGGLGIWTIYDAVMIAAGSFTDIHGDKLRYWTEDEMLERGIRSSGAIPPELYDEIDSLRSELLELTERVDFTERLLTRARASGELEAQDTPV